MIIASVRARSLLKQLLIDVRAEPSSASGIDVHCAPEELAVSVRDWRRAQIVIEESSDDDERWRLVV